MHTHISIYLFYLCIYHISPHWYIWLQNSTTKLSLSVPLPTSQLSDVNEVISEILIHALRQTNIWHFLTVILLFPLVPLTHLGKWIRKPVFLLWHKGRKLSHQSHLLPTIKTQARFFFLTVSEHFEAPWEAYPALSRDL